MSVEMVISIVEFGSTRALVPVIGWIGRRAIETQERIIQTTTELKKAIMHKLVTKGLRNEPQRQTEIGPIPESWQANLYTTAMKTLKVVLPDEEEQSEIATCFKSLDQKAVVAGQKCDQLQDLFRTLLHKLMPAKTRVQELEIAA